MHFNVLTSELVDGTPVETIPSPPHECFYANLGYHHDNCIIDDEEGKGTEGW